MKRTFGVLVVILVTSVLSSVSFAADTTTKTKSEKAKDTNATGWVTAVDAKAGTLTVRFPVQSRHWFRSIPATQSDVIRPLIPEHSGHLLRESKRIF